MKKMKATTLAIGLALATAGNVYAGSPLITDDAGTVDVGKVEVELNGEYVYDKVEDTRTNSVGGEVKISTGLYENLGISLVIPYRFNERTDESGYITNIDGFEDMTLEIKYKFLELAGIDLAIKPTIIMPTGNYSRGLSEGRWQFGGKLIATKEFEEGKYALHANFGYEYHHYREDDGSQRRNLWSGSIAGEAEVLSGLFGVADFGVATTEDKSTDDIKAYAMGGLRYELCEFSDIYAGVKFGLSKPEDDVTALYGVTFKF